VTSNDTATILIVDDSLDNLGLLFEGLRQAGYEVLVAQDGPSALKRVAARKPDLVLLDVIMPDMDGFTVAAHLKAQPSSQDIPIIFLTAVQETPSIVKGFAVGGVDYLIKPVRMEEALARIHTHVSLHQLQNRLEARTRELTTLLDLSHSLVATLDLEHLANLILDQLNIVVEYTGCALLTLVDEKLCMLAYRGPTPSAEILQACFPGDPLLGAEQDLFVAQQPLVVVDVHADKRILGLFHRYVGERATTLLEYTRAWMGIPLVVRQQVIGGLSLSHERPGAYTAQQAELATAFAHYAAIAIENARLYQQAREVAIHEERNRLARNLHDSVNQSLFSAKLIADLLPQMLPDNLDAVRHGLAELQRLTQGALTEMRTLLLELRPAALLKTRLDELLRQLAHAATSQTLANVTFDLNPAPDLPPEVHITFYRVAQEAFNNIVRHAHAQNITVVLHPVLPGGLTLDIQDDGRGFDVHQVASGNLGLEIMHERAKHIAARLTVTSQPGQGTQVTLCWPADSFQE
jgi:signal transduction histidine kinase/DNA-binding response OmpR family regulator